MRSSWIDPAALEKAAQVSDLVPAVVHRVGLLVVAIASLAAAACDGFVSVDGRVYRLPVKSSGDRSMVIGDDALPDPDDLEPLPGAEITLYHSPEDAKRSAETARRWRSSTVSASDGTFSTGGACAPGSYEMALGVEHEGCETVLHPFHHSARDPEHKIVVILACREQTERNPRRALGG